MGILCFLRIASVHGKSPVVKQVLPATESTQHFGLSLVMALLQIQVQQLRRNLVLAT